MNVPQSIMGKAGSGPSILGLDEITDGWQKKSKDTEGELHMKPKDRLKDSKDIKLYSCQPPALLAYLKNPDPAKTLFLLDMRDRVGVFPPEQIVGANHIYCGGTGDVAPRFSAWQTANPTLWARMKGAKYVVAYCNVGEERSRALPLLYARYLQSELNKKPPVLVNHPEQRIAILHGGFNGFRGIPATARAAQTQDYVA